MVLDSQSQPHVITFKQQKPRIPDVLEHSPPGEWSADFRMYHYWRDPSGEWHDSGPVAAMSKRPGVIFDARDTLVIYYPHAGAIRCHTTRSPDDWATWTTHDLALPDTSVIQAGKPDRLRAVRDSVLSFAVSTNQRNGARGFSILDFDIAAP